MLARKLSAEFIGVFALVFIGVGALIVQGDLGGVKYRLWLRRNWARLGR